MISHKIMALLKNKGTETRLLTFFCKIFYSLINGKNTNTMPGFSIFCCNRRYLSR